MTAKDYHLLNNQLNVYELNAGGCSGDSAVHGLRGREGGKLYAIIF